MGASHADITGTIASAVGIAIWACGLQAALVCILLITVGHEVFHQLLDQEDHSPRVLWICVIVYFLYSLDPTFVGLNWLTT